LPATLARLVVVGMSIQEINSFATLLLPKNPIYCYASKSKLIPYEETFMPRNKRHAVKKREKKSVRHSQRSADKRFVEDQARQYGCESQDQAVDADYHASTTLR
tara:strand:- start:101 stop:412 length:312 start_codon:yes stop_codon:yes gene_type:complete